MCCVNPRVLLRERLQTRQCRNSRNVITSFCGLLAYQALSYYLWDITDCLCVKWVIHQKTELRGCHQPWIVNNKNSIRNTLSEHLPIIFNNESTNCYVLGWLGKIMSWTIDNLISLSSCAEIKCQLLPLILYFHFSVPYFSLSGVLTGSEAGKGTKPTSILRSKQHD